MTTQAQTVLGRTDLCKFIAPLIDHPSDKQPDSEIDTLTEYLYRFEQKDLLSNERPIIKEVQDHLQKLHHQRDISRLRTMYRTIDISFLKATICCRIREVEVAFPQFATHMSTWHSRQVTGFSDMLIRFGDNEVIDFRFENVSPDLHMVRCVWAHKAQLKIISSYNLKKISDMWDTGRYVQSVTFKTSFVGLVPQKTREAIDLAEPDFGENIMLVRETEPHDWNISDVVVKTIDPMIIGIKHGVAFLLDVFDTTPLEQHIAETMSTPEVE